MTTTQIFKEASFRRTKYTIVCPDHGYIGKRYIADDAERFAIDHELEHIAAFV